MISFRKHAPESTRRPNSFLNRPARRGLRAGHLAALMILLLAAHLHAVASPQQKPEAKAALPTADAPRAEGKEEPGRGDDPAAEARIPVRVRRVKTPEGPGVVATIGDFPTDLNEAGQEFLKREFFEHFASDVLGLGDSDTSRAMLKIAMLPQEKENQREGDFTFGKVSGHMVVVVERRRVLVACTFAESDQVPQMLAGADRLFTGADGIFEWQQKSDS